VIFVFHLSFANGSSSVATLRINESLPYEFPLIEGSWIHYRDDFDYFYYFFSGNECCTRFAHYSVMVARSRNVQGPYTKRSADTSGAYSDDVILQLNGVVYAPGYD